MKEKGCDERIDSELKSRLDVFFIDFSLMNKKELAAWLKVQGADAEKGKTREDLIEQARELHQERACEGVLSVETRRVYRVLLSWGGPSDFFDLDWDIKEKCWLGGRYHFQDWYDGASRVIDVETAEKLSELWGLCPECE